jgi:hypothetical protein
MTEKNKYILFFGDSFCASLNDKHFKSNGCRMWQGGFHENSYSSLVADHYQVELMCHGYGGKSWWYSRSQFESELKKHKDLIDRIDAMIFCHTDWYRINSDNMYATTLNLDPVSNTSRFLSYLNSEDQMVAQAQTQWHKYLYDEHYQEWSMQNWFRELSTRFKHKKQVHFHSFKDSVKHNNLLIGQRFTTPLSFISVGEMTGTVKEIMNKMSNGDTRANHLSLHNNQALAQVIIDALDNYQDQTQELDTTKFEIVNPNYINFPGGNFGTE